MEIELTPSAVEEFRSLPGTMAKRVRKVLDRLENWPDVSGVKALSGNLAGLYRIRTGDYRIRFYIDQNVLIVDKIAHRKDVYED